MTVQVLEGHCLDVLRTLPAGSVHCCVTSPPYYALRDYQVDGQIGLEATPAEFIAVMVEVSREVRRVLRDDGTLFLNLGDSYFAGPVRRASAYGTSGKAPGGSPVRDCLCESLCDVCRKAYRIGKFHTDGQRDPRQFPSPSETTRAHTESPSDHPPTLDSFPQAGRIEDASPYAEQKPSLDPAPLLASPASMQPESFQQPLEDSRQSGQPSGCRLCGCSLQHSAPASVRMAECMCGTSARGSGLGTSGKGVWDSAYRHSTTGNLKPKDLMGIPWRVAFALQDDGWYLRQDIIWHKPNPMPESIRDRCTKAHEYLFLLAKSERYYFDFEAFAEPRSSEGGQGVAGWAAGDGPHDAVSHNRDKGDAKTFRGGQYTNGAKFDNSHASERDSTGNKAAASTTRNRRSVWTIATDPFKGAHFATYPPALVEPCILAGCPVGGTVLDPFGGAGTTGLVADRLQRNAVLIELNPTYAEMARRRIHDDAPLLQGVA